jgi:hypothetical protein
MTFLQDDLEVNGSRKKEFSICSANTDSDVEILNEEDEEEEAQPLEDNGVGLETEVGTIKKKGFC